MECFIDHHRRRKPLHEWARAFYRQFGRLDEQPIGDLPIDN
jgi:hypothetical protein